MKSIRIQYVKLEIKRTVAAMRRMAVRLALLTLLLLTLLCGISYSLYRSVRAEPIQVALVVPEDQEDVIVVSRIMSMMDSVAHICQFVYPKEQEVEGLFERGEIQAAVLFTEDFINDVNHGKNTPVQVLLGDEGGPGIRLFRELLNAGLYLIDATEAACYALEDVMDGREEISVSDAQDQLMSDYIADAFYSRDEIRVEVLSPTGEVELTQYYAILLLLLFLLLCGIQFSALYDTRDDLIDERLRVYGVGILFRTLCKLVLMTAVFWVLELPCLFVLKPVGAYMDFFALSVTSGTLVGLLFLAASMACFYHGLFSLGANRKERKLLSVLVIICMLVLSGCIVPSAYLPQNLSGFSMYLPFTTYRYFLEQMLFGQGAAYGMMAGWDLLFLAVGCIGACKKGNSMADARYQSGRVSAAFFRRYQKNGPRELLLRIHLFFKWQWKRKIPLVTACFMLCLCFLCGSISFPDKGSREVYLCGMDRHAIESDGMPLLQNTGFHFVFYEDEDLAKRAVLAGDILAAGVRKGGTITIYTAAYAPGVMAAKETMAAMLFAEHQGELLQMQCERIFGTAAEDMYTKLDERFSVYMRSEKLLQIIYQSKD